LLKLALDATLQAASVIDDSAADAWSGSHGRRTGTIGFDGERSCDPPSCGDRYATDAIGSPTGRRASAFACKRSPARQPVKKPSRP